MYIHINLTIKLNLSAKADLSEISVRWVRGIWLGKTGWGREWKSWEEVMELDKHLSKGGFFRILSKSAEIWVGIWWNDHFSFSVSLSLVASLNPSIFIFIFLQLYCFLALYQYSFTSGVLVLKGIMKETKKCYWKPLEKRIQSLAR